MKLSDVKPLIHEKLFDSLVERGIEELRPSQIKSIDKGLLENKNLLVCTPTASGKTLIAELCMVNGILNYRGKAIYIVPLKALANEKFHEFKKTYPWLKIGIATSDLDESGDKFSEADILFCTSEKLDSMIRHGMGWLRYVATIVIDEIHLLNDASRGPTLEVLITLLKMKLPDIQLVGLSATIGNPEELSEWLDANLVQDHWRPVKLEKGIFIDDRVDFFD